MIQGHRHVLDHVQESSANQSDDIHYFTIGAGALLEEQSWISDIIGRPRYDMTLFDLKMNLFGPI